MLSALVSIVLAQNSTVLYRGSDIPGSDTKYWSVEDTQVDRADAERSSGQGMVLFLGKDKRVFLRFGDLRRALGPNKRIVSAKLILTPAHITTAGKLTLSRMGTGWHESPGTGGVQLTPPLWSTSWNYRHYGQGAAGIRWRDGGREFISSTPSASANVGGDSMSVELDGLGGDVQAFYDRWYENNGWALDFAGEGAFNSAENRQSGPRLEIVTENIADKTGADLSVTYIERTPEYKRYDNRGNAYTRMTMDGHESGVMMNPGEAESKKWPSDGEEVTYTAHIKNVGTAPANGFSYEWSQNGGTGDFPGSLAPGQETTVTFKTRYKSVATDHRTMPVALRIRPKSDDAIAGNDFLEIQANALNLGIWVDQGFYDMFSTQVNGVGSRSFEDWIQWQFRIWNDVFMRHSRFAFAEDGIRESVRIGRITVVPNGTLSGGVHMPNDTPNLIYDGEWGFDSAFGDAAAYIAEVRNKADRALIHEMSHQIGLVDMYVMNVEENKVHLKVDDKVLTRGAVDPYPGLMGGGDTRNDLLIPTHIPIPYEPTSDVVFASPIFQPTDLYARTDAAALNANIGYRRGYYGEYLYSLPGTNLLRVSDRNGGAIAKGALQFYQTSAGEVRDSASAFSVDFENGIARLPARPTGLAAPFTTLTGHTLSPNPFGRIDVVGGNGVFLVRLDHAGRTEWKWLKIWQLFDAGARGSKVLSTHELRFNVSDRPIKEQDWALKKTAIDSSNSSGENIAALIDGDRTTIYAAGEKIGDWVEIDIGRDRPIGEVKLLTGPDPKAFWQRFDVMVYGTGQTVNTARVFAGESNWNYAVTMEKDSVNGVTSVAYRAPAQTVRFIRLVNKSGGAGSLGGIEIRETEIGQ